MVAAAKGRGADVLVVTGLAREGACVTGDGLKVICSGADSARLRAALATISDADFAGVVSFGLAGGLDPSLRPGDAIVGAEAICGEERFPTDERLAAVLREGFAGAGVAVAPGAVAGVNAPVMNPQDKALLRETTGAAAVDMESHVAARFAAARGLPFAIVRVVSDPAARALPKLAASAVTPDGGVDMAHIMKELAREPGQIGDLLLAGRDARAAFATLRRCGALLGPLARLVLAGF